MFRRGQSGGYDEVTLVRSVEKRLVDVVAPLALRAEDERDDPFILRQVAAGRTQAQRLIECDRLIRECGVDLGILDFRREPERSDRVPAQVSDDLEELVARIARGSRRDGSSRQGDVLNSATVPRAEPAAVDDIVVV